VTDGLEYKEIPLHILRCIHDFGTKHNVSVIVGAKSFPCGGLPSLLLSASDSAYLYTITN
jgi:hypothetical protein